MLGKMPHYLRNIKRIYVGCDGKDRVVSEVMVTTQSAVVLVVEAHPENRMTRLNSSECNSFLADDKSTLG